jgi:hypothetical protein
MSDLLERIRTELKSEIERVGGSLHQSVARADVIARILRAHLVVESRLRAHVAAANPELGSIDSLDLSFERLRRIVVGMKNFGVPELAEPLSALNRIRNGLAHHLDREIPAQEVLSMARYVAKLHGTPTPEELAADVARTAELFAVLAGLSLAVVQQLHLAEGEIAERRHRLDADASRLLAELGRIEHERDSLDANLAGGSG